MVISVAELEAIELWEKLWPHSPSDTSVQYSLVALMITAHPAGYYNYVATVKG